VIKSYDGQIQSVKKSTRPKRNLAQPHLENVHYQHADFDAAVAPEELLAPTANSEEPKSAAGDHSCRRSGRNIRVVWQRQKI